MSLAGTIPDRAQRTFISIDLEALRSAALTATPFPFLVVPGFVRATAHEAVRADFPEIGHPGSFPLATLRYGPAFAKMMAEIQGAEMTSAVAEKFGMALARFPTMVTVRGMSREADGRIHTDSRSKILTALIYMNDAWESGKGRLRLLRSPERLDDFILEVPPERGTLLIFRNGPGAWHGFESFSGPRRVIQLNWVSDAWVVRREVARHRLSAFFKHFSSRTG